MVNLKKLIPVLHEDEHYIVFDKPSGLLVVPTPKKEENTLIHIVNFQKAQTKNNQKLHPCHRLDRDTSGVILFAKGKSNQQKMMDVFKDRAVKKTYIAFVHGQLSQKEGQIKHPIKSLDQKKYLMHSAPKPAITDYKVLAVGKGFSIVEVMPITGRSNQIRIHFNLLGHPLLGERKYAIARDYSIKFRRVALHAQRLEWVDIYTNTKVSVDSNLPNDMEVFRARNRN